MKNRLDLLRKTRLAWLESPPRLRADSPEPGEVLALGPTRHHNVEWVVLARAREHRDWLLVVAADALSLVGSGDLSVHAPNHGGPLVMRCRVGGWLDIGPIAEVYVTSTLAKCEVALALAHRAALELGLAPSSVLTTEVDDDPDYHDWIEESLRPAWRALAASGPIPSHPCEGNTSLGTSHGSLA